MQRLACSRREATPPVARFRLRGSLVAAEAARRHVGRGQHALPSSTAILAPASSSIDMLGCGDGGRPAWGVDDAVFERGDTRRRSVQRKCKSRHARARSAGTQQGCRPGPWPPPVPPAAVTALQQRPGPLGVRHLHRCMPQPCSGADAAAKHQGVMPRCSSCAFEPSCRGSCLEMLQSAVATARWCCSLAGPPASGERGRRRRRLERRSAQSRPPICLCICPAAGEEASHARMPCTTAAQRRLACRLRTLERTDVSRRPRAPVVQAQLPMPVSPCAARPPACSTMALARPRIAPLPASGSAHVCRSACDVEQRRLNDQGRRFGGRRLRRRARKCDTRRSPPSAPSTPGCCCAAASISHSLPIPPHPHPAALDGAEHIRRGKIAALVGPERPRRRERAIMRRRQAGPEAAEQQRAALSPAQRLPIAHHRAARMAADAAPSPSAQRGTAAQHSSSRSGAGERRGAAG
jgi:hypothetical protein